MLFILLFTSCLHVYGATLDDPLIDLVQLCKSHLAFVQEKSEQADDDSDADKTASLKEKRDPALLLNCKLAPIALMSEHDKSDRLGKLMNVLKLLKDMLQESSSSEKESMPDRRALMVKSAKDGSFTLNLETYFLSLCQLEIEYDADLHQQQWDKLTLQDLLQKRKNHLESEEELELTWQDLLKKREHHSKLKEELELTWQDLLKKRENYSKFEEELELTWQDLLKKRENSSKFEEELELTWQDLLKKRENYSKFAEKLEITWQDLLKKRENYSKFEEELELTWQDLLKKRENYSKFEEKIEALQKKLNIPPRRATLQDKILNSFNLLIASLHSYYCMDDLMSAKASFAACWQQPLVVGESMALGVTEFPKWFDEAQWALDVHNAPAMNFEFEEYAPV